MTEVIYCKYCDDFHTGDCSNPLIQNIAHKQDLINRAMTELETLRAENTRLSEALKTQGEVLRETHEKLTIAMDELKFYGEKRLYTNVGMPSDLYNDQGKRARSALSRIEGVGK